MKSSTNFLMGNKKRKYIIVKRLLVLIISIALFAYLSLCLDFIWKQDELIYGPSSVMEKTPTNFGLDYQEIFLPIPNAQNTDENLFAWWLPGASQTEKVLVYFHGSDGNITDTLTQGAFFHQLGFSVLLFDYRGYGKSRGKFPSEKQVYEDGQIIWDYLTKARKINPSQILLYGHSLGGAIIIELALHNPQISGLIMQSTFTTLEEVLKRHKPFKFLPLHFLLHDQYKSIDKISSLAMPLLFIHGIADGVVPFQMSERLFAKAKATKKELVLIHQADHSDLLTVNPAYYQQGIEYFYQQIYPQK
jgi:uncharacterized protein